MTNETPKWIATLARRAALMGAATPIYRVDRYQLAKVAPGRRAETLRQRSALRLRHAASVRRLYREVQATVG